MREFVEKTKMCLCWHSYKRIKDNYIYTSPVTIPQMNFDESTGILHMEEIKNNPKLSGGESVYKCSKCGKMKIICFRDWEEE